MEEFSYWDAAEAAVPYKNSRAYQSIAREAAQVARETKFEQGDFGWAVRRLYDAYGEFLSAMNSYKIEPAQQNHWYNHFRDARLAKKSGEPEITHEVLAGAAHTYLKEPLRVPMMDRGLLDAFIAQETFAHIDSHAGRGALFTQFGCYGAIIFSGLIWSEPRRVRRRPFGLSHAAIADCSIVA